MEQPNPQINDRRKYFLLCFLELKLNMHWLSAFTFKGLKPTLDLRLVIFGHQADRVVISTVLNSGDVELQSWFKARSILNHIFFLWGSCKMLGDWLLVEQPVFFWCSTYNFGYSVIALLINLTINFNEKIYNYFSP